MPQNSLRQIPHGIHIEPPRPPSESVTGAIIECATDAIVTIDENSTILSANASVDRIFGYSPSELIGKSLTTLMPPELRSRHLAAMAPFPDVGNSQHSMAGGSAAWPPPGWDAH